MHSSLCVIAFSYQYFHRLAPSVLLSHPGAHSACRCRTWPLRGAVGLVCSSLVCDSSQGCAREDDDGDLRQVQHADVQALQDAHAVVRDVPCSMHMHCLSGRKFLAHALQAEAPFCTVVERHCRPGKVQVSCGLSTPHAA
jgi:hypothetical protein